MRAAQRRQGRDPRLDRGGLPERRPGADRGSPDALLALPLLDLRREHVLPGPLVRAVARTRHADLVAVVDDRHAAREVEQVVGQQVALEQRLALRSRVGRQEEPDPAHVVVAEEGGQAVGVGRRRRVVVIVGEQGRERGSGRLAGDEPACGLLVREVQHRGQLAGAHHLRQLGRVGVPDLAEARELRLPRCCGGLLDQGQPPSEEVRVHVLGGVDPEAVDAVLRDPRPVRVSQC